MNTAPPIIPPEAIGELATTVAAALVAGLETLGRDYEVLHTELAELRDELHALANRIESVARVVTSRTDHLA